MVGFGFSAGDFVDGINLVRELIKALEDSAGSAAQYRALISELYSLERALLEVQSLDLDEAQHPQSAAIRQAASQFQHTVDDFLRITRKFQPSFSIHGSGSSWRNGIRRLQWSLYKKEDVQRFRAQISGHAASINMLLLTVQL